MNKKKSKNSISATKIKLKSKDEKNQIKLIQKKGDNKKFDNLFFNFQHNCGITAQQNMYGKTLDNIKYVQTNINIICKTGHTLLEKLSTSVRRM